MIVLSDFLKRDNCGKVLFNNELFSGVCLNLDKGIVTSSKVYNAGEATNEPAKLPFTLYDSSVIQVDEVILENRSADNWAEPMHYLDEPFNGIAYSFEDGTCQYIRQYKDSFIGSKAEYSNGQLIVLEHIEEDGSLEQSFTWAEKGDVGYIYKD